MISVCDAGENHPMMCVQSGPSMLSVVKVDILYIIKNTHKTELILHTYKERFSEKL